MKVIHGKTPAPDLPGYGMLTEPDEQLAWCVGCHERRDPEAGVYCADCKDFICHRCFEGDDDSDHIRCAACEEAFDEACRDAKTNDQINRRVGK